MLNLEVFQEFMDFLIEAKGWKLSDFSSRTIYDMIQPLVNDAAFADIASKVLDQEHAKPDALVKACREHRKIQQNSAPPALPPARMPRVCDEQIKFSARVRKLLSARVKKVGAVPSWPELWAPPVTDEERAAFSHFNAQQAVNQAVGAMR